MGRPIQNGVERKHFRVTQRCEHVIGSCEAIAIHKHAVLDKHDRPALAQRIPKLAAILCEEIRQQLVADRSEVICPRPHLRRRAGGIHELPCLRE